MRPYHLEIMLPFPQVILDPSISVIWLISDFSYCSLIIWLFVSMLPSLFHMLLWLKYLFICRSHLISWLSGLETAVYKGHLVRLDTAVWISTWISLYFLFSSPLIFSKIVRLKYLAFQSRIRTRPRKCVANSFTKVRCCSTWTSLLYFYLYLSHLGLYVELSSSTLISSFQVGLARS